MAMTPTIHRRLTLAVGAAAAAGTVALAGVLVPAGAAVAAPSAHHHHHGQRPVVAGSRYLALGDSVPFGFRESTNLPTPDYTNAKNFTGFPEDTAGSLGLKLANSACPGETTSSFLNTSKPSNGCENSPDGSPGYRDAYPLHVKYSGSQMAYALHYLRKHHSTRLVSLMIGANDGFLCQETTADHCQSELGAVTAKITKNVHRILAKIRNKANYSGQIVIVKYYSLNYSDQLQNASSQIINNAVKAGAQGEKVKFANGYKAFKKAAAQAGGDTCAAGLLTTLSGGGCGVHPSVAGQSLLGQTVAQRVKK